MFVSYAPTQVSAYGAKRNPGLEISMRPALKEHQRIASAYDVTDEQRSRRPIFNATLWAAAGWLFFGVARSAIMIQIAALRSRLEKQPTDLRRNPRDFGDGARDQPRYFANRSRSSALALNRILFTAGTVVSITFAISSYDISS